MRIDAEKMDKFQGTEDIRRGEQTLRNQLHIEIAPVLSRYQRGGRIRLYLGALLKISRQSENAGRQVEHVSRGVDKIPHVPEIRP